MKIFLIRHGESTQNIFDKSINLPDHLIPLTAKGQQQANDCGVFLKEYCKKNEIDLKNSVMFVSPFERTRQTAKIINEHLGLENVKEDAILIERQHGLYDNLTFEERKQYKTVFDYDNWMFQNDGYFYSQFPLGESPFDVMVRARIFLETLFRDMRDGTENFFIVSHGIFIKSFQMAYFHYSPEWFNKQPALENCSIKLFERIENRSFDRDCIYHGSNSKNEK